jgi:hypothetical protein
VVFRYDGPDISSFQAIGDWAAVAATGAQFAGIRLGNGPFSEWDPVSATVTIHPGFVDPHAGDNLVGARASMRWRALYYVVTPLESPEEVVNRVATFFALHGLKRSGELIAIDYEGNPNRDPDGNLVAPDEWCSAEQVEEIRAQLAQTFGATVVGAYGSRGWLDRLDLGPFGWRWLASYTLDAANAARARGCEVVQWTSSAVIDGIAAGRVDMNEVLEVAALDAAAGTVEVAPVGSPKGSLDVVEDLGGGKVHVSGWAYDEDAPDQSIDAHVYINGLLAGVAPAANLREDVNAALGITGAHGFDAVFDLLVSTRVDVYGINVGDGANSHIGGRADLPVRVGLVAPVVEGPPGPTGDTGPTGPAGEVGPFDPEAVRSLVRAEIAATPFETKAVPTGP